MNLPTHAQVSAALAEEQRVTAANEPITAAYREIRKLTTKRNHAERGGRSLAAHKLSIEIARLQAQRATMTRAKLSDESRAILKAERDHTSTLRRLPPQQWAMRIRALPDHIQVEAACVIWWDFFGGRVSAHRWPHLDFWINQPVTITNEDALVEALLACGYTPYQAQNRVHVEERMAA